MSNTATTPATILAADLKLGTRFSVSMNPETEFVLEAVALELRNDSAIEVVGRPVDTGRWGTRTEMHIIGEGMAVYDRTDG